MAQSAVEKAAKDIGGVLSNSMAPVNSDVFGGTSGDTTAKFDWSWNYINPVSGRTVTLNTPSIEADTVRIYVGTRKLSGDDLGGAGGAGISPSVDGPSSGWVEAVDLAEAASNASMSRGSGPTFGTISGSPNYSGQIAHYDVDYGLSVGNLWFDTDTDNNGSQVMIASDPQIK